MMVVNVWPRHRGASTSSHENYVAVALPPAHDTTVTMQPRDGGSVARLQDEGMVSRLEQQ